MRDQAEYDFAIIFVFNSDKERNKYFTAAEGGMTELGKAASKKLEWNPSWPRWAN